MAIQPKSPDWTAEFKRSKHRGPPTCSSSRIGSRRGGSFHIVVRYDDGSTVETDLRGRKADPNLRMPSAALVGPLDWSRPARLGRTGAIGRPRRSPGRSDPPEQDVGSRWPSRRCASRGPPARAGSSALNPKLLSNAELIRDTKDPSQGDLFFQPDRDLSAQRIKVMVAYENEKLDSATLVAGRCDPKLRMPLAPLPKFSERADHRQVAGTGWWNPRGAG